MFGFIWKSKKSESSGYKLTVLFDLDQTLIQVLDNEQQLSKYQSFSHLTKAKELFYHYECLMIHLPLYETLFKLLLNIEGVRIGFITSSEYDREEVLELLTREYGLPEHALDGAIYVNRHKYGNAHTLKGAKIKTMRRRNIFAPDEQILLIDDNIDHLHNAVQNGCSVIHATGLYHYVTTSEAGAVVNVYQNDKYFDHINDAVSLLMGNGSGVTNSPPLVFGI